MPSSTPDAPKPRSTSYSEWLLKPRIHPDATAQSSSLPGRFGLAATTRLLHQKRGTRAFSSESDGMPQPPDACSRHFLATTSDPSLDARDTDDEPAPTTVDDTLPSTDSRPALPQQELPPFPEKIIYHRMPTHLSCQQQWDPMVYATENNLLMTVQLFGSEKEIEILLEMWQEGFNSLLHLIENMLKSGYSCYDKLSIKHLVIINNRFELRDGVPLIRASLKSYNRDYGGGGDIIETLVNHVHGPGSLNKVPDLKKLTQKMRDAAEPKGYPLLVDPSLMPLHNRGAATVDVYNFLMFEVSKEFQNMLLRGLIYTPYDEWVSIARTNDLLSKLLDGGIIDAKVNKTPVDFVEYLRVCYCHILDFRRILENVISKRTRKRLKRYSKKHANLVIYGNYPLALSDIYGILWIYKKLKMINPHLYFRYRQ